MKKGKKKYLSLLLILLAFCILTGSVFAFFSDIVRGNVSVTAGTLDIEGTYEIYLNGSEEPLENNIITNFNPGDYIVIVAKVHNLGTKSAWIRDQFTLRGELASMVEPMTGEAVISVYYGNIDPYQPHEIPAYRGECDLISGNSILNGSVEVEENGQPVYISEYTIFFSDKADNMSQNKDLVIDVRTEALQYRNNTDEPGESQWGTVVDTEFTGN